MPDSSSQRIVTTFRESLTTRAITARLGDRTIRVNALGLGHFEDARLVRRLFSPAAVRVRLAGTAHLVNRHRFHGFHARSSASLASYLSRDDDIPRIKIKSVHVSKPPSPSSRQRHQLSNQNQHAESVGRVPRPQPPRLDPGGESPVAFSIVFLARSPWPSSRASRWLR